MRLISSGSIVEFCSSREIAIFNLGESFVAMENRCPHRGGPLADGIVSATGEQVTVTCPLHNWRVAIDSGHVVKPTGEGACVRTYPVKVENGVIAVGLILEEEAAAYLGVEHTVGVANGTDALVLVLEAMGIGLRARALAAASPDRSDEIEKARDRLVSRNQMGNLFKVMALAAPHWPEPAGFE